MKELKVYKALKYFDNYELNRFKKYIDSPFFNKDVRLIGLLNFYLKLTKKGNGNVIITESYVWDNFNIKKPFNIELLRRLNSDLLNHLVGFLAQEELDKNKLLYNNLKFKGVGSKKIDFLFKSVKRTNERELALYPDVSSELFYANYVHEKIITDLQSVDSIKKHKANIQNEITIDKVSYNLDQFYIIEKLKLYINLLSWQKSFKIEKSIHHIDELKNILSKQDGKNEVITAYLIIIKTLEEPEKEIYFNLLRSLVQKHSGKFSIDDFIYIYNALISYSITSMNKGNEKYINISLDIYKDALQANALIQDDILLETTFNNIVAMACRNGEMDWAKYFIDEYAEYLESSTKENTVSFASARIEFYKKNYENVIEILQLIDYETVIYNLNAKSLLLFSYYEIGEFDALDSLINSFKVYLNRERSISASRKKRYNQLLGFVKRIANINPRDKKKIARLKGKLTVTQGVLNKNWLLDKINELETK